MDKNGKIHILILHISHFFGNLIKIPIAQWWPFKNQQDFPYVCSKMNIQEKVR